MISYLNGKIIKKELNSSIIVVNNIGYEVFMPNYLMDKIKIDDLIEIYTYIHIREDNWQLYGFSTWEEKDYFTLLLNVSGIGPRVALGIVSNSTINQLNSAIQIENIAYLTKLPGVGKKTAQRMILELKEKINQITITEETTLPMNNYNNGVIEALLALGYQMTEVDKIYPKIIKDNPDSDEAGLIKSALKLLAKV
ncbi:Holliday junction DNA helicase subunit RuvA [Desulfonispora thiosulfatigenes DSM 11270]|uniref:Holliday junction branch migration complex subunit RuvA n=1 Tax=Desulfonispora thiosulfatigenes DSM 11270 TaxID=656914 RepID=A0A1W1VRK5_DESTI|nr:Holliday junction branch migration protein RuvA [Desulfonispora thiosulfatigenes]SMB95731.1 Holliday junction DNA helicase subunit RuvA [Desulfonispora thiosulfatigenes DSM 11270]